MPETTRLPKQTIDSILACIRCGSPMHLELETCASCGEGFERSDHQLVFDRVWERDQPAEEDTLNSLKESVKTRLGSSYTYLVKAASPVCPGISLRGFVRKLPADAVIVNLGSGTTDLGPRVVNVDLAPYAAVDLVTGIEHTPIRSASVDAVISIAVLEHVPDPKGVVAEMTRILKPGGRLLLFVPFMQGIHASPHDYQRYTPEGLRTLLTDYEIQAMQGIGPTSALLWVFQEWISMLLSLGIKPLYRVIFLATHVLAPLKFLDWILRFHPMSQNVSSGTYVWASKR